MLNINVIAPDELTIESKFKFRCYPGISCYKSCCKNIDIMLTPYDILRLKNRFDISSGEFLMNYTYVFIEPKSGYPFVFLNKNNDEEMTCPFYVKLDAQSMKTDLQRADTIQLDRHLLKNLI